MGQDGLNSLAVYVPVYKDVILQIPNFNDMFAHRKDPAPLQINNIAVSSLSSTYI